MLDEVLPSAPQCAIRITFVYLVQVIVGPIFRCRAVPFFFFLTLLRSVSIDSNPWPLGADTVVSSRHELSVPAVLSERSCRIGGFKWRCAIIRKA
jgi:hypothetical protein